jgi:hypothetical protein
VNPAESVLRGVSPEPINGWHRWGSWAAHFFVDGIQSCNTKHTYGEGGIARGFSPRTPSPVALSVHAVPYGKVCQRCLKASRVTPQAKNGGDGG